VGTQAFAQRDGVARLRIDLLEPFGMCRRA
jgi:hypothetical protein